MPPHERKAFSTHQPPQPQPMSKTRPGPGFMSRGGRVVLYKSLTEKSFRICYTRFSGPVYALFGSRAVDQSRTMTVEQPPFVVPNVLVTQTFPGNGRNPNKRLLRIGTELPAAQFVRPQCVPGQWFPPIGTAHTPPADGGVLHCVVSSRHTIGANATCVASPSTWNEVNGRQTGWSLVRPDVQEWGLGTYGTSGTSGMLRISGAMPCSTLWRSCSHCRSQRRGM